MHWFTRPGWPGNLLALLAGTLTTLSLAPFDIWPLALLSVALLPRPARNRAETGGATRLVLRLRPVRLGRQLGLCEHP